MMRRERERRLQASTARDTRIREGAVQHHVAGTPACVICSASIELSRRRPLDVRLRLRLCLVVLGVSAAAAEAAEGTARERLLQLEEAAAATREAEAEAEAERASLEAGATQAELAAHETESLRERCDPQGPEGQEGA
jgi:hypothetical protein